MTRRARLVLGLALALMSARVPASAADAFPAPQRAAVGAYAASYGTWQGWQLVDVTPVHGDFRRAYYQLHYLANPGPAAAECFAEVVTVDSCDGRWYIGGFPFYLDAEARVARCGPGWYAVSTPLDRRSCGDGHLPRWAGYRRATASSGAAATPDLAGMPVSG